MTQQIILTNGTVTDAAEYSKDMHLPAGYIAKHFQASEFDCGGELLIAEPLLCLLDAFREKTGQPVKINSGYRTEAKQQQLREEGYKAASVSPHCHGMASDIDTQSRIDTTTKVALLKQCAKALGLTIRLGYNQYLNNGQTFIHVDVCPMYYGAGKPFHGQPHPAPWESHIEW